MKICSKCGIEKELGEFHKQKGGKYGVKAKCKCCYAEWYAKAENKARQAEYYAEYYSKPENKAKKAEYYAEYMAKPENKAKKAENDAEYRTEYEKERRATDPLFKLRCNIRHLIRDSIKRNKFSKDTKTAQILGCSFDEFKEHIESQFQYGMTWDNQGKWHLDHIYPVSLAESEEHLIQLNNYNNFQPMWAEDNLRKGNKTIDYMKKVLYNIIQQNKLNTTT